MSSKIASLLKHSIHSYKKQQYSSPFHGESQTWCARVLLVTTKDGKKELWDFKTNRPEASTVEDLLRGTEGRLQKTKRKTLKQSLNRLQKAVRRGVGGRKTLFSKKITPTMNFEKRQKRWKLLNKNGLANPPLTRNTRDRDEKWPVPQKRKLQKQASKVLNEIITSNPEFALFLEVQKEQEHQAVLDSVRKQYPHSWSACEPTGALQRG